MKAKLEACPESQDEDDFGLVDRVRQLVFGVVSAFVGALIILGGAAALMLFGQPVWVFSASVIIAGILVAVGINYVLKATSP